MGEFFCQLSILSSSLYRVSVAQRWKEGRKEGASDFFSFPFFFFRNVSHSEKLWPKVGTDHLWYKSSGQHSNMNKSAVK